MVTTLASNGLFAHPAAYRQQSYELLFIGSSLDTSTLHYSSERLEDTQKNWIYLPSGFYSNVAFGCNSEINISLLEMLHFESNYARLAFICSLVCGHLANVGPVFTLLFLRKHIQLFSCQMLHSLHQLVTNFVCVAFGVGQEA